MANSIFQSEGLLLLYCGVIFVSVFFAWLHSKTNVKIFGLLAVLMMSVFAGARGADVGTDFPGYLSHAISLSRADFSFPWDNYWQDVSGSNFEYGYGLMIWCLSHLFENKTIVFSCVHGVFFFLVYWGCWNISVYARKGKEIVEQKGTNVLSKNYAWVGYGAAVFMWLFLEFNVIRQGLAMSAVLAAVPFFLGKRYFPAGFLFCLALSFHLSAVFVLPWILFVGKKSSEITRIFICIVFFLFISLGLPFIANIFGYGVYFATGEAGASVNGAICCLPLLFFIFLLPRDEWFNFSFKVVVLLLYTAIISFLAPYVNRLYLYTEIGVIVLAVLLSEKSIGNGKKILWWIWLFCFTVLYRFWWAQMLYQDSFFYFEWIK